MNRPTPKDLIHEWDDTNNPKPQYLATGIALALCIAAGWVIAAVTN